MPSETSEFLRPLLAHSANAASDRKHRLEDEVTALFDLFRIPVLRYLTSLGLPPPDADEILQDVFLALFQHLRSGKPRTNLQGWIFKVAHNLALKSRTRAKRDAGRFTDAPLPDLLPDDGPGPEAGLVALQRHRKLLAVMRALPERDRHCLSLRAEGLRYREIADILGISLGSVAASLEKSLTRLNRADQT